MDLSVRTLLSAHVSLGPRMKALVLEGSRALRLREIEAPEARPGEALVRVEAAGIGGSEYLGFANPGIRPLPNIMGHSIAGITPDGRRVTVNPLRGCGACAACSADLAQLCDSWSLIGVQSDGGFAQVVSVPFESLVELPEDLSWEQVAFVEPFANSVNAWEISGAGPSDRIAVIGAGGLGLGLTACAAEAGCETIAVCDLSPTRLQAAHDLSASDVGHALAGRYDVVFDTVGSADTRQMALEATCSGGHCVFLGFASALTEIDISSVIRQQKRLSGAFVYSARQFSRALGLARLCRRDWVRNLSFEGAAPLLEGYLAGDFSVVRAALRPNT